MKIAICDDEKWMVDKLKHMVELFWNEKGTVIEIETFLGGRDLFNCCKTKCFDLLLLDIDMPETSGFDIAKEIRKYNSYITIIFITSMDELVYDSFSFRPFAFIPKNMLEIKLRQTLDAFFSGFEKKHVLLEFTTDTGDLSISPTEIMFFFTVRHDIFLYTSNDKSYRLSTREYTLNKLEQELEKSGFLRIHKSYLINYKYIYQIHELDVKLKNDQLLPLSRKRKDEIKNKYQILLRSEKT